MIKLLQKDRYIFFQYGIIIFVIKLYVLTVDYLFDINNRTNTNGLISLDKLLIKSKNKKSGRDYQATRVVPLKKLFNYIKKYHDPKSSVLVDFGSGKGRVLLVASNFCYQKVRGIEFAHALCDIAKNNLAIYTNRISSKTQFQIIESDVVDYRINSDENVFFMYNPFNESILSTIINNIVLSLSRSPRKILIIYHNPKHTAVIEGHTQFVKLEEYVFVGYKFILYSNSY